PVRAVGAVVAGVSRATEQPQKAAARAVTFNRDIAPILFDNCASCHRPIDDAAAKPAATSGPASVQAAAKATTPGRASPKPSAEANPSTVARRADVDLSTVARRAEVDPICVA